MFTVSASGSVAVINHERKVIRTLFVRAFGKVQPNTGGCKIHPFLILFVSALVLSPPFRDLHAPLPYSRTASLSCASFLGYVSIACGVGRYEAISRTVNQWEQWRVHSRNIFPQGTSFEWSD